MLENKLDKARLTDLLRQTSQEVGVSLSDSQIELFWLYLQELREWNKTFNLTSLKDPEDIIIKHFVDSLTPLPYIGNSGRLLDLGPGAGFPSIPLKIAAPELTVQLVDSSRKKVSFLKHLTRILKLESVSAVHSRLEDMELPVETFQIIISRAFLRFEPLLELVSPILKPGSILVAMLGPTSEVEQKRFSELALAENLKLHRVVSLELPRGRGGRTILFFKKK